MTDSIPIVYYGQGQGMHGNIDPYNHEALWPSGYQNTTAVQLITKLNKLCQWMIKTDSNCLTQQMPILSTTATNIIIQKGPVISVITNISLPEHYPQLFHHITDFAYP
jgi:alpha-amylase